RELLGELDREAVGRVQVESVNAADLTIASRPLLEDLHAVLERLPEALLLGPHDLLHMAAVLLDLRVPRGHLLSDDVSEAPKVFEADRPRLLHGAPDDAAQHVPAPLVRGRDPVR